MPYKQLDGFPIRQNWPDAWGDSGTAVIVIDTAIVADDGTEYPRSDDMFSSLRSIGLHWESPVVVNGGVANVLAFADLLPTTDTCTPPNVARYYLNIYDSRGSLQIRLTEQGFTLQQGMSDVFTWQQWVLANQNFLGGRIDLNAQLFATIQRMVDAAALPLASNLLAGKAFADVAPLDSAHPEFVGSNSPLVSSGVVYASGYTTFAQALAAATNKTLVITQSTPIGGNQTVPSTVALEFKRGGMLTGTTGQVLTLQTDKIIAPLTQQIFSFTDETAVRFTNGMPAEVSVKWFGAKGDEVTDDILAFRQAEASFRTELAPGGYYKGGRIVIPSAAYKLSQTWDVYLPLEIIGLGNGIAPNATVGMRWPTNTPGIRVHRYNTSSYAPNAADIAQIRNLAIVGSDPVPYLAGYPVTPNGVANVSGLNLTRVSGLLYTGGTLPVAGGVTVRLNNFDYMIAGVADANHLNLAKPKFIIRAYNTSSSIQPAGINTLPSGSDWVGQLILIGSDTYTITAQPDPITLTISPAFSGADGVYTAELQTLATMTNQNIRINAYHGIDAKARVIIENVQASLWGGNALNIDTSVGFPGTDSTSLNADLCRIVDFRGNYNSGSGVMLQGIDSNACLLEKIDMSNNGGYGVYDNSFLGNTHIQHHTSYNILGSYRMDGQSAANLALGLYAEGGQPAAAFGVGSLAIGGVYGDSLTGPYILTGYGGFVQLSSLRSLMSGADGTMLGLYTGYYGALLALAPANDTASTGAGGTSTNPLPTHFLSYGKLASGWFSLNYNDPLVGSLDPAKHFLAFSGSQAAEGASKLWIPSGQFYFGYGANRRNITNASGRFSVDGIIESTSGGFKLPNGTTLDSAAWTAYTPTLAAAAGAFTTASATGRYKQIGQKVDGTITITITTNGTAASSITATLPVAPVAGVNPPVVGVEKTNHLALACYISAVDSKVNIFSAGGTYPGLDAIVIVISFTYEAA